jgi:2-polyprenyl-6-methoxyphenol hydroxylase-like FAD-dependent oxidoreductase
MRRPERIKTRYDAVVVGARVAGASTTMLLARAGLSVLAIEKGAYASDTLSTHALMRAGVMQLNRWGVLDRIREAGTPPIRVTTFHYNDEEIEVLIKERDGVDALYAPRRTVIDPALADAARASGAQIVFGARVESVLRDDSGRVCGLAFTDSSGVPRRVDAGIVIGADGARSGVARSVGADVLHRGSRPGSFVYGYWRGLDLNGTHWYYGRDVAAGAIPTNDGVACVFVGVRPERYETQRAAGLDELYRQVLRKTHRSLAQAVASAQPAGKLYPFAGRPGYIRQSWGPGWALVGDAGCFKDPLTAHGMTDALRDAELLANAVIDGSEEAFASYQSERDGFAVGFLDLSDEIASFDWDLDRVKGLHYKLSKLMTSECEWVLELDEPATACVSRVAR